MSNRLHIIKIDSVNSINPGHLYQLLDKTTVPKDILI